MDVVQVAVGVATTGVLAGLMHLASREERNHPERFKRWAPWVFGSLIAVGLLGVLVIIASIPSLP